MQKSKKYTMVKFPPKVVEEAYSLFCGFLPKKYRDLNVGFEISCENESLKFDSKEEFLSEYQGEIDGAMFIYTHSGYLFRIGYYNGNQTSVTISLPSREDIEKIFGIFDANHETYRTPEEEKSQKTRTVKKDKTYRFVKFPPEAIKEAYSVLRDCLDERDELFSSNWEVRCEDESWSFASEEEFWSEYRKDISSANLYYFYSHDKASFGVRYYGDFTEVGVSLSSKQGIERVFEVFEANYEKYRIPEEELKKNAKKQIRVFIGHGHSQQWRDLKDHLQDKHGFKVTAYETGSRAGYTISEVLNQMSDEASIAFLVHTAEDKDKEGTYHARENVIHETGLFQGKLGFKRAIVLLEDGCNEFSNISGIQQLRFGKDNVKEIFGEVLSTIYREFREETENDG